MNAIKTGFYGNDSEIFYVTPVGGMMTPDEAVEAVRRVEAVSGETLVGE